MNTNNILLYNFLPSFLVSGVLLLILHRKQERTFKCILLSSTIFHIFSSAAMLFYTDNVGLPTLLKIIGTSLSMLVLYYFTKQELVVIFYVGIVILTSNLLVYRGVSFDYIIKYGLLAVWVKNVTIPTVISEVMFSIVTFLLMKDRRGEY